MGCDIHMFAEVRKDGRWHKVGPVFPNPYYRSDEPESESNRPTTDSPYVGQNYDLFAMLAGERNDWAVAGIPTGRGFEPISPPRGVPEDASREFGAYAEAWLGTGYLCHCHSWLTLEELLAYDWKGKVTVIGTDLFSEGDYFRHLRGQGRARPPLIVDFVGVEVLTPYEYEDMLTAGSRDHTKRYVICEPRRVTYYERAREFVDGTLPELAKLGDPKDVRIAFFFDN